MGGLISKAAGQVIPQFKLRRSKKNVDIYESLQGEVELNRGPNFGC